MTLLDAVNLILPKLGERPVSSLDTQPNDNVSILLPIIDIVRKRVLERGWWFNAGDYEVLPDDAGELVLGEGVLSFIPQNNTDVILRGQRLYDKARRSFVFTDKIAGAITEDLDFDELPQAAATYIVYTAAVEAFVTDQGESQEVQTWRALAGMAWSDLLMQHLRNKKHSTRKSFRWRKVQTAIRG